MKKDTSQSATSHGTTYSNSFAAENPRLCEVSRCSSVRLASTNNAKTSRPFRTLGPSVHQTVDIREIIARHGMRQSFRSPSRSASSVTRPIGDRNLDCPVEDAVGDTLTFTEETEGSDDGKMLPHRKLLMELSLTCIVSSALLFLCQLVAAGCLCRPVIVLGGLWNAAFFLVKGILGIRVAKVPSHGMLVGNVVLAILSGITGVLTAAYLVSGHITVSCLSNFHRMDQSTAIRLYVLEFTAILASIPCIAGSVASFISAAISAQAAKTPKPSTQSPVVVFLKGWTQDDPVQQAPPGTSTLPQQRASTPPPNYAQINRESFA